MRKNKLLEKIIQINPKLAPQYREISEKSWKEPNHEYILAEFSSKVYMLIAVFLWSIGSFGLIFSIVSLLSENMLGVIGWGIMFAFLSITGFFLLHSSHKQKKESMLEKEKYIKAKNNKPSIDNKLKQSYANGKDRILTTLVSGLKKSNSISEIDKVLRDVIYENEKAQRELEGIYYRNKVYHYNLNEPMEIDSFKKVDSFILFEECNQDFVKMSNILYQARNYASIDEEELCLSNIESLLSHSDIKM